MPRVLAASDSEGYARTEPWSPGVAGVTPPAPAARSAAGRHRAFDAALARASAGERLDEAGIVQLFGAREGAFEAAARRGGRSPGAQPPAERVRYVVNRNINYTNICSFRCRFCAFSKGKTAETLRGQPYDLALEEVARRVQEAWARGATEVCMQGGIHPAYTGETYVALLRTVKRAEPQMHVHAFSPLEVTHGARSLSVSIPAFLARLRDEGLGSLPGTAAEILDDAVRARICPDKLSAGQWIEVVEAAHRAGLRTTSTIMFGHVETPHAWARHLLAVRDLQERTGGITEFVPLPFVHMEAPMFLKEGARRGPTWRETLLMHAVARLALHPLIPNIQVSWVKLGRGGRRGVPRRGSERPRRHAHEREHLPRCGQRARRGASARSDGSADPAGRATLRAADDPVPGSGRGTPQRELRRRAARARRADPRSASCCRPGHSRRMSGPHACSREPHPRCAGRHRPHLAG